MTLVTCGVCKGSGEVHKGHPKATPARGFATGLPCPEFTGGTSGEIKADKHSAICSSCHGTGSFIGAA